MTATLQLSERRDRLQTAWIRFLDPVLIGTTLAISALGMLMIYSSTRGHYANSLYVVERQGLSVLLGIIVMTLVMAVDYRKIRDFFASAYVLAALLLFVVLSPLGSRSKGTQGWFSLPGGFQLQPSELAKFLLIIALAGYLYHHQEELNAWRLAITIGLVGIPIGLVLLQPDLGTAMVFAVIVFTLLAVSGARGRHLLVLVFLGITAVVAVVQLGLLKQYQVDRLTSFVNPSANSQTTAYNTNQSKTAIGNGGITGRGLFKGSQTTGEFVPEQHTDFIFTAVGEELGFIGGITLLGLFGILIWRMWRTGMVASDFFGQLVCFGVIAMFVFQIFENIGMTMGIMPVTGIPLPFMSYGGSSTVTAFACVGLVANVGMHRFR